MRNDMKALLAFGCTMLGSYLGWILGERIGFITACYASVIGMGVGIYVGRRLWQRWGQTWG
jgi:hypothetical protein